MIRDIVNFDEKKLTLLCPIKDRPAFSKRFIKYLINVSCPFQVVIADGSIDNDMTETIELAQSHGLNIKYKKYPPDKTWSIYLDKMCDAIEKIQTPYACMVCDDDFYDFDVMREGIEFLEKNSKYKSFAAEVIDFKVVASNGKGVYGDVQISETGRHCSGRYKSNQLVEDDDIYTRLNRYKGVWPYEYIHKTSTLYEVFHMAKECNVSSYRHLLPIFKYITLIRGHIYYTDTSFTLRQENTPVSEGEVMLNEFPTYLHFLANKKNSEIEADIYNKITQSILNEGHSVSKAEIQVVIQANLLSHYQESIANNIQYVINTEKNNLKFFLSVLWRIIFRLLRHSIVRILPRTMANFIRNRKKVVPDDFLRAGFINMKFLDDVRKFLSYQK
jgi:glycosyltransferase domain-containing protein